MKKIAIVADDIAMPGEKGLGRLHYLAEYFAGNGFDVEIITADFQHWEKRYRTEEEKKRAQEASSCKITFLHEKPYSKNIEPKRILSYRGLAKNIDAYLRLGSYDLIYALIPDNYISYTAGKYAKERGIPFIVDVEDLWPEAMRMVLDIPVVSDVLFSYFSIYAKKTYALADGIVGSSDEYRDEPLKYGIKKDNSVTVYVGNDLAAFDAGAAENAGKVEKGGGEFWITYAGTLGTSYDIHTLIKAAGEVKKRGYDNIKIKLLGDGPLRGEFEATAKSTDADVEFTGYLPYPVMCAYLKESDVTVNSLVSKASQSIVSKIGDYLAAGAPMINTGLNPEFRKKVETDGFGINVEPENVQMLADAMIRIYEDRDMRDKMSGVARKIAEEQFDRNSTYKNIVRLAEKIIENK